MKKQQIKEKTRAELLSLAAKLEVSGRHKMNRESLIAHIAKASKKTERNKKGKTRTKIKATSKPRKNGAKTVKKVSARGPVPEPSQPADNSIGKHWQEEVEQAKFQLFSALRGSEALFPQELPREYGETRIVVMVRDPYWAYAYWEIGPKKIDELREKIGGNFNKTQTILRVYDITGIAFDGFNAHLFFDIEITGMMTNWYINLGTPDRTYCVDIGLKTPQGDFYLLARSNPVTTPRAGMSDVIDEAWEGTAEEFQQVYALSAGRGGAGSLEFQEMIAERLQEQITSPGITGIGSEGMPHQKKQRAFWFTLHAELIVYGATEPDANVYVQGRQLRLRPDGTFSVRFALPDGTHVIPVTAESSDGVEMRSVIPTISRSTERHEPKIKR